MSWLDAIMGAIRQGGLFAVDVDIVPTRIGQACHVWLPAATSGEMTQATALLWVRSLQQQHAGPARQLSQDLPLCSLDSVVRDEPLLRRRLAASHSPSYSGPP